MTCIQKIYHSFTWSFLDLTCFDIQCLSCWCSWSRDNCGKSLSTGFHRLFRRCRAFFCTLSQSWSLSERLVFPPILSNWHNFHFEIQICDKHLIINILHEQRSLHFHHYRYDVLILRERRLPSTNQKTNFINSSNYGDVSRIQAAVTFNIIKHKTQDFLPNW